MAEYSISSEDDKRVDAPTTSTPLLKITYVHRRKRRLEDYLAARVGLLFTLIETNRDISAAMTAVYCQKKTY